MVVFDKYYKKILKEILTIPKLASDKSAPIPKAVRVTGLKVDYV